MKPKSGKNLIFSHIRTARGQLSEIVLNFLMAKFNHGELRRFTVTTQRGFQIVANNPLTDWLTSPGSEWQRIQPHWLKHIFKIKK